MYVSIDEWLCCAGHTYYNTKEYACVCALACVGVGLGVIIILT